MQIQIARTPDDIALCRDLRRRVFIDEQGISEADENDGQDGACRHVLATARGEPIGTARFRPTSTGVKIQRVCVLAQARGQGIGARIIEFVLARVREEGGTGVARLGAQTAVLGFYERLGFEVTGPEYLDAGIPHRDMELAL